MKKRSIRFAVILCAFILTLCQGIFLLPEPAQAETPGETLVVRVQYAGEWENKLREKARFTKGELEAMGASLQRYSNVTRVGTVLSIIARGPELTTIIEEAGIDLNSIQYITFRTGDGTGDHSRYSRNFYVGQHLTSTRFFYPNLQQNYERYAEEECLMPLPGSLKDPQTVPAILALESYSTKQPSRVPQEDDMTTEESYRFCLGQPALQEGVKTAPGYEGGDVTAMESAQIIFGMDITLYGSPVEGIRLDLKDKDLKVGSKAKISATIEGDELFAEDLGFGIEDLDWSSSDESIAVVDRNGTITVKKEGTVTITATAPNGMTASVTIHAKEGAAEEQEETPDGAQSAASSDDETGGSDPAATVSEKEDSKEASADQQEADREKEETEKKEKKKPAGIVVKEVKIGSAIEPEEANTQQIQRKQMANDAQALDEAEGSDPYIVFASAYTGVLVLGFGATFRIRRFFKEV